MIGTLSGSSQVSATSPPSLPRVAAKFAGAAGFAIGVAVTVAHGPFPEAFSARTAKVYWVPLITMLPPPSLRKTTVYSVVVALLSPMETKVVTPPLVL